MDSRRTQLTVSTSINVIQRDTIFCFYTSGAKYRKGNGLVAVTDLQPGMCTHMVYQYIRLTTYGTIYTTETDTAELQQFVNLRNNSPGLKIIASIGGTLQTSSSLSTLMNTVSLRNAVVTAIVNLVNEYGLDGIDFYWMYPVLIGGIPEDRDNFVTLLGQLKEGLGAIGKLLTISVAPTKDFFWSSYNVPEISSRVDYVNVMAFDLRAYWTFKTGHSAPAYQATSEASDFEKELNVDSILKGWINAGLSSSKIILGVSTEGHSFKLASSVSTGVQATAVGAGTNGEYTQKIGVLSYLETCELVKAGGWTSVWDNVQKAHYAYKDKEWISYESTASLEAKLNLAAAYQIKGIGLWAIEGDDVRNVCGGGSFTLLQFLFNSMDTVREEEPATTVTSSSTVTTTTVATTTASTAASGLPEICPSTGFVRDPDNCARYYRCTRNVAFAILSVHICTDGLYFDTRYNTCNWKAFVEC
ncbi:acidic mammalian chitinase-like isoform X3 [Armigeres subalbatus]|uniref:acidic mammalian chitinase-like isoform X3 n=1 Tax=Armigeres subalbatus TaxID=124917 RepID=UPI002ED25535